MRRGWTLRVPAAGPILPAVLLAATLIAPGSAANAQRAVLTGVAEVTHGDTVKVGNVPVRLHGIDATEDGQSCKLPTGGRWRCDEAARDRLDDLVAGREVRCEVRAVDAYGRPVSSCTGADGVDVGEVLVTEGLAWALIEYSDDYVALEQAARAAGRGLWRDGALPQAPWAYRADKWERAAASSPRPGCPIKGNVNGGNRIYHTPWSRYYSRVQIDESDGERWFCDEGEAAAAGWRQVRSR